MPELYVSIECGVSRTNVHVRIITITRKGMEHGIRIYVIYGSNFLRFSFHWFVRICECIFNGPRHNRNRNTSERTHKHTSHGYGYRQRLVWWRRPNVFDWMTFSPKILVDFRLTYKDEGEKIASNTRKNEAQMPIDKIYLFKHHPN